MKLSKALLLVIITNLLFSCTNPVGNTDNRNYELEKIGSVLTGSVFRATFPVSDLASNIDIDNWSILYQIENDGSLKEVLFKNSDNQDLRLNLTKIYNIGFGYIGIEFSHVQILDDLSIQSNIRKAVIRISDGVAFDFSDYLIETAQVYKNYLYIVKDSTIYVVDINVMDNALPLNNPTYDPFPNIPPNIFSGKNSYLVTEDGDVLLPNKVFYINTTYSPKSFSPISLSHPSFPYNDWFPDYFLYDLNGTLYALAHNFENWDPNNPPPPNGALVWAQLKANNSNGYDLIGKTTIDLTFAPTLTNAYSGNLSLYDKDLYIIGAPYGFYKVSSSTDSINVSWIDLNFPFSDSSTIEGLIVEGNYCYWQEKTGNKAIKRLKLENSSVAETLVDIPGVRTGFSFVDDKIIYNKNISALQVNTYSFNPGDTESILMSTSNTLPEQVVTLEF